MAIELKVRPCPSCGEDPRYVKMRWRDKSLSCSECGSSLELEVTYGADPGGDPRPGPGSDGRLVHSGDEVKS